MKIVAISKPAKQTQQLWDLYLLGVGREFYSFRSPILQSIDSLHAFGFFVRYVIGSIKPSNSPFKSIPL
jgi:hypothetical protein